MAAPPPSAPLPILGWKEHVELPEWGLRLRGKLDTGARSSALHVTRLEEIGTHSHAGERLPVVRFDVVLGRRDAPEHHEIDAPVVGHKVVRDTGARAERRPVVRTRIRCGPLDTVAGITLTDRTGMIFRMLLGRRTLEGACLVDPAHGYLVSSPSAGRTVGGGG
ncbi:ATP-dependent zinc protease family protein [Egicoccus halophilus]|uniref:Ribosomal protein S6 modification protein n=1 Tax=Egicoccus halophilus TaxID=1670830 RepID=A0A8J3A707_9ACTN|nr:RimK/LysX family protein [Egicoccus halophilus]GGI04945.1 ribosomal protein S6 modification protein [Egicoccus halophilus]